MIADRDDLMLSFAQTLVSLASIASIASLASLSSVSSVSCVSSIASTSTHAAATTARVRQEAASARQQTAGPGPRSGHSLVYDAARKRLVMVDGYVPPHDSSPGELWTWDGRQWSLVPGSGSGPSKRIVGSAAFDVRRNRIVSFGGSHSSRGMLSDTWEWDGVSWTQVAVEGPVGRSRTGMVYDSARKQLVLFGGAGVPPGPKEPIVVFDDTWVWNGAKNANGANGSGWRRISGPSPPPRYAHAMAFDSRRNVIVMYGGAQMSADRQTVHLEDMWQWDGERWTEIKMTGPTPGKRYSPAMAFDPSRNRIVLTGGLEVKGRGEFTAFDDVWEWDRSRWTRMN